MWVGSVRGRSRPRLLWARARSLLSRERNRSTRACHQDGRVTAFRARPPVGVTVDTPCAKPARQNSRLDLAPVATGRAHMIRKRLDSRGYFTERDCRFRMKRPLRHPLCVGSRSRRMLSLNSGVGVAAVASRATLGQCSSSKSMCSCAPEVSASWTGSPEGPPRVARFDLVRSDSIPESLAMLIACIASLTPQWLTSTRPVDAMRSRSTRGSRAQPVNFGARNSAPERKN